MTNRTPLLTTLLQVFPEDQWPWLLPALRCDDQVWTFLDSDAGSAALAAGGDRCQRYSPAELALGILESPLDAASLRSLPMQPLSLPKTGSSPALGQAGQEALRLRELRRSNETWDGLAEDLGSASPTALSCLFGIVPDPGELLQAIALSDGNAALQRALHALLSNPMPPQDHLEYLIRLSVQLQTDARLQLMEYLASLRSDLAVSLAQAVECESSVSPSGSDAALPTRQIASLATMVETAVIHQIAQKPTQASEAYAQAAGAALHLQADLLARKAYLAEAALPESDAIRAWGAAVELDGAQAEYQAGLCLSLLRAGRSADAQSHLESFPAAGAHPWCLLASARLALSRGNHENAQAEALRALEMLEFLRETGNGYASPGCVREADLARLFMELSEPDKALQAIRLALSWMPNEPEWHSLFADASLLARRPSQAVAAAQIAAALTPENPARRKQLAECLEHAGDWSAALLERTRLAQLSPDAARQDHLALAACALQAGQPDQAIHAVEQILADDETDGLAWAIVGAARALQADRPDAFDHLMRAVHYAAGEAFPWLALANLYRQESMLQKAVETLQAACQAAPNQPALPLMLGEMHATLDSPSQALSALRQAYELAQVQPIPHDPFLASWAGCGNTPTGEPRHLIDQIALSFGKVLLQLGHIVESSQVLEPAYQRCPTDPQIGWAYARALLAQGQLHQALLPLEAALHAAPPDIDACIVHARTVLELAQSPHTGVEATAALPSIRQALELEAGHLEAQALLAEALAASGDYEPSLAAFQHALDSELAQQPAWQARLEHGLGRVAMKLGQVETAVAALQEASQAGPTQPAIWRSLSEAYHAAGLTDEALQAARSAVRQAPSDVDTLVWFADQALLLKEILKTSGSDVQIEAVHALERAVQVSPEEARLRVKLGETWLKIGQPSRAQEVLAQLAQVIEINSQANPQDLYLAALGLLKLDDPASAILCLERALEQSHLTGNLPQPGTRQLLTALVDAYSRQGNLQAALAALVQLIQKDPSDPMLYVKKAGLLLRLQRTSTQPEMASREEILSSVKTALEIDPNSPALQSQAAAVFRQTGLLPDALLLADRIIQSPQASEEEQLSARSLAAEAALAMLQPGLASAFLDYQPAPALGEKLHNPGILVNYHCLRAGISLQNGNARSALADLAAALELAPDHVQVLALQARLAHRRSDPQTAQAVLTACLQTFGLQAAGRLENHGAPLSEITSLYFAADAALELRAWEEALYLWRELAQAAPDEPLAQLGFGRALVLQAEFQRLCQVLDIVQRAPGESALSAETLQQFEDTIVAAEQSIQLLNPSAHSPADATLHSLQERGIEIQLKPAHSQIRRWRMRGLAAFHPTHENALALAALQSDPDDAAARVACLRQLGEPGAAALAAREFPHSPQVLVQLAIALSDDKPRQAMAAIHLASDLLSQSNDSAADYPEAYADVAPLVNVLIARLYHHYGNRATDRQHALKAIEEALAMWSDEPRWHVLAAEILAMPGQSDVAMETGTAVNHLQTAIYLSPADPQPHLSLGHIYLKTSSYPEAVRSFQQGVDKAPDFAGAWIGLARAQRAAGDLEQAAASSEQAVALAPNLAEPLLLRGEIALQAGDPEGAHSRAQAALRLEPESPLALLLMARTLSALDRPEDALQMLEKVLPLSPNPLPLSLERVRLLDHSKGLEFAIQAAQELSDQYPEDSQVHALLAEMMDKAGQSEKAIRSAQKALKSGNQLEPLPEADQANMHFLLGKLLRRSGQLDQAVHHLSETIQLAPQQVEAYLELGQAHQERRQHLQAMNAFQEAIRVSPKDYRSYYQIGVALKESKDYVGSERMLRQAAELAPDDLSIRRLLAAVVALNLVHNRRDTARETTLGRFP